MKSSTQTMAALLQVVVTTTLKIDLMQLFPQNYALDSSGSYETKIEFLSDYIEQRAMQLVEERLKN